MKAKSATAEKKPIVQTVKINQALYERLTMFGARTRRTNQDILHTALLEYLKKMKA